MDFQNFISKRRKNLLSWGLRGLFLVVTSLLVIGINQTQPSNAQDHSNPSQERILSYQSEIQVNEKRIKIYREGVKLDRGIYAYTIDYQTDRQLDFSKSQRDRLFWNVTGQDWSFPIDHVRAKVLLPDGIPDDSLQLKAFTGREGEKGQSYNARLDAGENPTFTEIAVKPRAIRRGI